MENSESRFQNLYKNKSHNSLQTKRRETLLKEQKLQRSLFQDETRNLQSILTNPQQYSGKLKPSKRTFKNKYHVDYKLQLSEWLKEKPDDLNDWLLVPCPKGMRCMVIACNGYTEMYNKSGRLYDTFDSLLPGNVGSRNDVTILDCIYVETKSTFYVLDALTYGNQDLLNCEAEFRFFWLKSKFLEGDFDEIGPSNPYAFVCLDFYDFQNTTRVSLGLQDYPLWQGNCPELDGFLFYHKEASYTCGTTPLVGWLFSFMVPEVLGFAVNPAYMEQKPDDYTDYGRYIIDFDEEMVKKKYRGQNRISSHKAAMEEDVVQNEEAPDDEDASLKALLKAERDLELGEQPYIADLC